MKQRKKYVALLLLVIVIVSYKACTIRSDQTVVMEAVAKVEAYKKEHGHVPKSIVEIYPDAEDGGMDYVKRTEAGSLYYEKHKDGSYDVYVVCTAETNATYESKTGLYEDAGC